MKRHKNLQPLSRQHHNALMAVLLLKKGIKKQVDSKVLKDFILFVWNNELQSHFAAEELCLQTSAVEPGKLYERMLEEHQMIRNLIKEFDENTFTSQTTENFYKLLEAHIRFEERLFFPEVEKHFSNEQLKKVEDRLFNMSEKSCVNYPVRFWE